MGPNLINQDTEDVNTLLLNDSRENTIKDLNKVGSTTNINPNNHPNQVSLLKFIILSLSLLASELQFAIVDNFCIPLQLKAHIPIEFSAILFSCVAIIGVLLSPVIGNLTDHCTSRFGRRKPFIIGTFIVSFLAETAAVYGRMIGLSLTPHSLILGQIIVVTGLIITYITISILMIPTRASVMDITPPDMHSTANSILSCIGCLGGLVGFALCGINWNMTILAKAFGGQAQASFVIINLIAIISVFVATLSYKEIPLEHQTKQIDSKDKESVLMSINDERDEHSQEVLTHDDDNLSQNQLSTGEDMNQLKSSNSELTLEEIQSWNILYQVFYFTKNMPKELVVLFVTSLLGWITFSTFATFYTNFVGQAIMKGNPFAAENSTAMHRYDTGVRYGSWGLVLWSVAAILYSLIVKQLILHLGELINESHHR